MPTTLSAITCAERYLDVPFLEPAPEGWDSRRRPAAFDCSTFVARVCIDSFGGWGEISAATDLFPSARWMSQNLMSIPTPSEGDFVLYSKQIDGETRWHILFSDGQGGVMGACDDPHKKVVHLRDEDCEGGWKKLPEPYRRNPYVATVRNVPDSK